MLQEPGSLSDSLEYSSPTSLDHSLWGYDMKQKYTSFF